MAKKNDGRDHEMEALEKSIPGLKEKLAAEAGPGSPEKKEELEKPPATPPGTPPGTPPEKKETVIDPEKLRTDILNETFGEQFKSWDEVKQANIPASLQELATLRQTKQDLETQLGKKPKHSFASDDLAKFNEFARESGIFSWDVFNDLNAKDPTNMEDMDVMILSHIIESPKLANAKQDVRTYIEMTYDLADAQKRVTDGDLTPAQVKFNQMRLANDADKARKKIGELKGKIKMPEIPKEETPEDKGPKKWTPEVEKTQKELWSKASKSIVDAFATMPIKMKDAKEPIINFAVPDEVKTKLVTEALNYAVNNQMEITSDAKDNQTRMQNLALFVYDRIYSESRDLIHQSIFDFAVGVVQKGDLEKYHNPSKIEKEQGGGGEKLSTYEEKRSKAYQEELKR